MGGGVRRDGGGGVGGGVARWSSDCHGVKL